MLIRGQWTADRGQGINKRGEIIDLTAKKRKLVLTNRPFGMGKYLYNDVQEAADKKARQIEAFSFILQKKFQGFILSGTKSLNHLRENLEAFQIAAQNAVPLY